jgi:CHAT domain-containing protein
MKLRPTKLVTSILCVSVSLLQWAASCPAQQPGRPPKAFSSAAPAQSAAPTDSAPQIDELMKQCNEQMNVKGQFERAAELAQQALDLSLRVGDKVRGATAGVYLASAYAYQGRLGEASVVAQKTLVLAREAGNTKVLEQALNTAAGVAGESGRYEDALAYLYECLDLARKIGDATMQYMAQLNMGEAYLRVGDLDKAESPLLESLRLAGTLKHSDTVSNPSKKATEMALLNLGEMEYARRHYQAALGYYERVHASRPQSPLWVITALQGMANCYEKLGEPEKAIDLFQEALPLSEKAASGLQYAKLQSYLGLSQESLGRLNEALGSEKRALEHVRASGGNPEYEWRFESRIAHIERAIGRNQEALAHYQNAVNTIELLQAGALNTEEGRASAVAERRAVYAEAADLLHDLHRDGEALEMAERGRARAFLDMLAVSRSGLPDELTPEQRRRENALLARISSVQKELWRENLSPGEQIRIKAELTSAENDLSAFYLEVRHSNPRYASMRYPEPIRVADIQKNLLDSRSALVEFLLGEKRSLVWVVSRDRVTTAVLPRRKEIEAQVAAYRRALGARVSTLTLEASLAEIDRRGRTLYDSLLQPVQAALADRRVLIIVPDGALSYLPFEALAAGDRRERSGEVRPSYLLEKFALVYGPSASALAAVQAMNRESVAPPKTLLAFGDPIVNIPPHPALAAEDLTRSSGEARTEELEEYAERGFSFARLPYTRTEVLSISKLFPQPERRVYLGAEALEEAVKTQPLDQYRYIHFATHGFIDEERPARSGLLFSFQSHSSEDGVLDLREITRLRLNADLVTLSACSTGLGKLVDGEGILGLTRAFFYAGARNVTVSLWNVNDPATAALMTGFYRNLTRGFSESEGLRQAKLAMLRGSNPAWRHPYFWAAFVLVGEGR